MTVTLTGNALADTFAQFGYTEDEHQPLPRAGLRVADFAGKSHPNAAVRGTHSASAISVVIAPIQLCFDSAFEPCAQIATPIREAMRRWRLIDGAFRDCRRVVCMDFASEHQCECAQ